MEHVEQTEKISVDSSDAKMQYQEMIHQMQKQFSYANIPNDIYLNLVDTAVRKTLELKDQEGLNRPDEKVLKRILRKEIVAEIRRRTRNRDQILSILNRYINQNFEKSSTYQEALRDFYKLEKLCDACMLMVDIDLLISLIEQNPIFSSMIETVYQTRKGLILGGKLENVTENNFLITGVNAYLEMHHIKIKETNDIDLEQALDNEVKYQLLGMRKYPLLKPEEVMELIKRATKGDKRAKDMIVGSNLRLVASIARRYVNRGMGFSDLIQEGSIGLLTAIDRFDPNVGFQFSTHATWWIRQAMIRAIENQSRMIRLPSTVNGRVLKVKREKQKLGDLLGRDATPEEIANETGQTVSEVQKLLKIENQTIQVSLHTKIGDDEDTELQDLIGQDENFTDTTDIQHDVRSWFESAKLTDREKTVLIYRFGLYDTDRMNLEEIGEKLHVSRERIRQIENIALYKLGKQRKTNTFSVYMDDPDKASDFLKALQEAGTYKGWKEVRLNGKRRRGPYTTMTLYERLNEYQKEEIDNIIETLSEKQKNMLTFYYGEDFMHKKGPFTEKERNGVSSIVSIIKRRLEIRKEIEESKANHREAVLPTPSRGEVSHNSTEKQAVVEKEQLQVPPTSRIDEKQKELGTREKSCGRKKAKSIYEYLSEYHEEEIDRVISQLNDKEKDLLMLRYGEDLHQPVFQKLSTKENGFFYGNLIPKIKRRLEKNRQENHGNCQSLKLECNKPLPNTEKREEVEPPSFQSYDYDTMMKALKDSTLFQMMQHVTLTEAVVVSLQLGLVLGKKFTTSDIALLFEIDENQIKDMTKRVLSIYHKELNSLITEPEQENTKKIKILGKK